MVLRLLCLSLWLGVLALRVTAQEPAPIASIGSVRGTVYDSLTRRPLRGATVQILGVKVGSGDIPQFSRFTTADDAGTYQFDQVPSGGYVVGFFHPSLDSLGFDLPLRAVEVQPAGSSRLNLAVPSHAGAIEMMCGRGAVTDSSALIVGFVRDATTLQPAERGSVLLEWADLVIGYGSIRQEPQQLNTETRADGWYAFCNVPVSANMELRGARGADTSGAVAANLVAREVVRRDLYVGPAIRINRAPVPATAVDSVLDAPSTVWTGPARLAGTIRGANGRPIIGAHVSVMGSESATLTNESGGFVLVDLPAGSQTVQARALGFVPERATVQLLSGEGAHQNVATLTLTTLRAVLDTIRVTASRVFVVDVNGFEGRKRAGIGHFVDRAKIDRQQPLNASDMLRMIPSVHVLPAAIGMFGRVVAMRTPFGGGLCQPDLYVDGMYFSSGTAELDELVLPDEIDGIEVYTRQTQAPMQYANRKNGCGSLVVWTRKIPRVNRKPE